MKEEKPLVLNVNKVAYEMNFARIQDVCRTMDDPMLSAYDRRRRQEELCELTKGKLNPECFPNPLTKNEKK